MSEYGMCPDERVSRNFQRAEKVVEQDIGAKHYRIAGNGHE